MTPWRADKAMGPLLALGAQVTLESRDLISWTAGENVAFAMVNCLWV